jgi:hypothetical protein
VAILYVPRKMGLVVVAGKNAPPVIAVLSHSDHYNCHFAKLPIFVNSNAGARVFVAVVII